MWQIVHFFQMSNIFTFTTLPPFCDFDIWSSNDSFSVLWVVISSVMTSSGYLSYLDHLKVTSLVYLLSCISRGIVNFDSFCKFNACFILTEFLLEYGYVFHSFVLSFFCRTLLIYPILCTGTACTMFPWNVRFVCNRITSQWKYYDN